MSAQPNSFICLYCCKEKSTHESSLEHGIPQFLGGADAPAHFELSNVCKTCNSNLGLFVDGSFARSWFVGAALQECAMLTFDTNNPHYEIPLICMGISEFCPPDMLDNEVCEIWLGPFGESVFLIRPNDERFYWYSGGNPLGAKQKEQTAYFFVSEKSPKNFQLALTSLRYSFKKLKVKKIMCTEFQMFDVAQLGFSVPDSLDMLRVNFFKSIVSPNSNSYHNKLHINIAFDNRFICKLGFAVAYGLFGDSFLNSDYAQELRKGIWHNTSNVKIPKVLGVSTSFEKDEGLEQILSLEGAVVIAVFKQPQGHFMSLSISRKQFGMIKIADSSHEYPNYQPNGLFDGVVYILLQSMKKHICMPIIEFINYKLRNTSHRELDELGKIVNQNKTYFSTEFSTIPLAAPST